MTDIPYEVVDVFTTTRFGGNPLAVITDARKLDDAQMQHIAAEFGYSETTFVLPPSDPAHTARVRIFTPVTEVPFAGHPNVGTGFVLARRGDVFGRTAGESMIFEETAGLVEVSVRRGRGLVTGASITAPRPLEVGQEVDRGLVADCVSLAEADIMIDAHQPCVLSVGLPFVFAQLADRAALARSRPNLNRFVEANQAIPLEGGFAVFLYVPTPGDPARISARMFAPLDKVPEDPATGSASAALGAFLAGRMESPDGEVTLTIEQGEDMGRPSQIDLRMRKAGGVVWQVSVAGSCVPVMRGELVL